MDQLPEIELNIYPAPARFEVEARLGEVEFACDLSICKGACCTMPGGRGAPLLGSEISHLERAFPLVKKYLPDASLATIEANGLYQNETDGSYTVSTIGHKECIFVTWEGDVALCAIQKGFRAGEVQGFEKPISCHLFPVRIYPEESEGSYFICYEEIAECEGGRSQGEKKHIALLDFLEHPLARALGKERCQLLIESFRK
ncbi:MAG: DUF3109 family protein [Ignavibacteriota bacterium]